MASHVPMNVERATNLAGVSSELALHRAGTIGGDRGSALQRPRSQPEAFCV